jgi:hypothetical protein
MSIGVGLDICDALLVNDALLIGTDDKIVRDSFSMPYSFRESLWVFFQ